MASTISRNAEASPRCTRRAASSKVDTGSYPFDGAGRVLPTNFFFVGESHSPASHEQEAIFIMLSKLLFAVLLTACSDAAISKTNPAPTQDDTASVAAQSEDESGDFETARLRAHRTPRRIEKFDANHDGMLQANEVPARLRDWFVKVDANKDNVVTAEEIRAWNRAHPHPHRHHNRDGGARPQHTAETTTL